MRRRRPSRAHGLEPSSGISTAVGRASYSLIAGPDRGDDSPGRPSRAAGSAWRPRTGTVEEQPEVAAPEVRRDGTRRLEHASAVMKTSGMSSGAKSGASSRLRPLDELAHERPDAPSNLVARLAVLGSREHLAQGAVLGVEAEHAFHEPTEARPRVLLGKAVLGRSHEGIQRLGDDRLDEVLLGREASVERPHADARPLGDRLDRDVDAVRREGRAGGLEDAVAVCAGIAPERRRYSSPAWSPRRRVAKAECALRLCAIRRRRGQRVSHACPGSSGAITVNAQPRLASVPAIQSSESARIRRSVPSSVSTSSASVAGGAGRHGRRGGRATPRPRGPTACGRATC